MRYVVASVLMLASVAAPLTVSAQDESSLELDAGGMRVAPNAEHREIERLTTGARRAKIALGVSTVPIVVGGLVFGLSYSTKAPLVCGFEPCPEEERDSLRLPGAAVLLGGVTWMIVAGTIYSVRRRRLDELERADGESPRGAHWDIHRSRLVF